MPTDAAPEPQAKPQRHRTPGAIWGRPPKPPIVYDKDYREMADTVARLGKRTQRTPQDDSALETARSKLQGLTAARAAIAKLALREVNGQAEAFCITTLAEILPLAEAAEAELVAKGVPIVLRNGAQLVYSPAGPSAKSYKYGSKSTRVTLKRSGLGVWTLGKVERCEVYPRQPARRVLIVQAAARDAIVRHALDGIEVGKAPAGGKRKPGAKPGAKAAGGKRPGEATHAPVT